VAIDVTDTNTPTMMMVIAMATISSTKVKPRLAVEVGRWFMTGIG
jgi:hypothetical protein